MALKTLHFVPGLSRTPLLFIPRYLTNIFFEHNLQKEEISRIENLKIQKHRFTNRSRALDIRERPLNIRERPLDSRERPLDFRKRRGGVGVEKSDFHGT